MPLETATYLSSLNVSNPAHTDGLSEADSHMRLIKSTLLATFPGLNAAASRVTTGSQFGFLANAGIAGAPSYSFTSNALLGFYDLGGSVVGLTGGLTVSGALTAATGTFSGATSFAGLTATTGTFSGLLTASAGIATTTLAASALISANAGISGTTGTFSGALTANGGVVATTLSASGAATISGLLSAAALVRVNDGTLGAPALAYTAEPGLGFYRGATSQIHFTGTLRGQGAAPAGAIMDFGATSAPAGWLLCDGQAVSRATYADLFAAIGIVWGAGDTTTTFNVPQLSNRFRRHRSTDGVSFAQTVGTLQNPLNLTHTHGVVGTTGGADTDHSHTQVGTFTSGVESADHVHGGVITGGGTIPVNGTGSNANPYGSLTVGSSAGRSAAHTHNTTISGQTGAMSASHAHNVSLTSGASGDASEARPYSATVLTCIKT